MSGYSVVIICKVMQTNIKQCVSFAAMFATLRVFQLHRGLLRDHPMENLYRSQPPPPIQAGASATPGREGGRLYGGCYCWYWNSAYYAVWTSDGCKSKGRHGCGAAVYNFRKMTWLWCEVKGDNGGDCRCYEYTNDRRVECSNG